MFKVLCFLFVTGDYDALHCLLDFLKNGPEEVSKCYGDLANDFDKFLALVKE